MVDHELAGRVLERALTQGGDTGELYVEDRRGFGLSLDDGRVERPQAGSERGARCRQTARRPPATSHAGVR